jgi:hypothetical protein
MKVFVCYEHFYESIEISHVTLVKQSAQRWVQREVVSRGLGRIRTYVETNMSIKGLSVALSLRARLIEDIRRRDKRRKRK